MSGPRIEDDLPEKIAFFTVRQLADLLQVSHQHITNLIDDGEIPVAGDLRSGSGGKAQLRIGRSSVVDFLRRRQIGVMKLSQPKPSRKPHAKR